MKKGFSTIILLSCFFLLAVVGSCNRSSVNIDKLDLVDLQGNKVSLKDYRGKTIFLNFWASWCGACRKEKPWIANAQKKLANENLEFIMVSQESLPTISKFVAKQNYDFNWFKINSNIKLLGVFYIPHTFIIDTKGNVVHSQQGERRWDSDESIAFLKKLME